MAEVTHLTVAAGGAQVPPMPHELATKIGRDLLHVLTLLRGCRNELDGATFPADQWGNGITCAESRAHDLLTMAEEKAAALSASLDPYL